MGCNAFDLTAWKFGSVRSYIVPCENIFGFDALSTAEEAMLNFDVLVREFSLHHGR